MIELSDNVRSCPIGCRARGQPIGELPVTTSAALSRTHYTLVQCGCRKLLYLSPAPTATDITTMYVNEGQFGSDYTDEARVRAILGYMDDSLERLEHRIGKQPRQPLRVLEIGAGLAWMCRAAKERNSQSVTVAQDVSPEAMGKCPWVDHYVQSEISDARLTSFAPFDIISMTHVIEHLVDAVSVVGRCFELIAPDGLLFITAPHRPVGWNEDTPSLALWTGYSYNHVPAHVQYFSEQSLARLAERGGFELVYWSGDHENGEAFEAWLAPRRATGAVTSLVSKTKALGRHLRMRALSRAR